MGRFVQGIEVEPAARVGECHCSRPFFHVGHHQPVQNSGEYLAQAVSLEELPFVKLGTVRQGKTGQQVVAVKPGGLG